MKALIAAATLAAWLIGADAQGISPEEITAAIEQGLAGKSLQKKCTARGDNGIDIVAEGPIGRIMRAAREAKKKKREFTAADVTPAMAGAWVTVTATRDEMLRLETPPNTPGTRYLTELLIKSKPSDSDQAIVLNPLRPIAYSIESSRSRPVVIGGGATPVTLAAPASNIAMPGSNMEASFDLAAFQAIPHKNVEIYVFMTDIGGHSCKINETERKALK